MKTLGPSPSTQRNSHILPMVWILALLTSLFSSLSYANPDPYQKQLDRLRTEMNEFGISIDVFGENPFQTGTTLAQYYVNEKTLLLETKSYFQTKANDLSSTEAIADLQYRNRVLRGHANNILLQLSQAIRKRDEEGMGSIEPPKHKEALEQILEKCKNDADCVARTLENKETAVENIVVTNLEAASEIFKNTPYLAATEVISAYQLTQMLYLEVMKNQARIAEVEFSIFQSKQKALAKAISKNPALSEADRRMQFALVKNTVNKWKKRIIDRRNSSTEYLKLASPLLDSNFRIAQEITSLRSSNSEILGTLYHPKRCRGIVGKRRRNWCKGIDSFQKLLGHARSGQGLFVDRNGTPVNGKGTELPESFFEEI